MSDEQTGERIVRGLRGGNGREPTPTLLDRQWAANMTTAQVQALEPAPAVIDGILYEDSLAMLYGPSGIGKSFLALDWALHVGHDSWWQGHEVAGGPVLYVVAEGVTGLGVRITAWQAHNRLRQERHTFVWHREPIHLADLARSGAFAEMVAELKPKLLVVDTLARCTLGVDENSAKDVGLVISNLDAIRAAARSCVLLVHHTGKDPTKGGRGSTALRGAMDTELEVSGDSTHFNLKNTKQKNASEVPSVTLGLIPVPLARSVAVGRPDRATQEMTQGPTLAALMDIAVPGGVSATTWRLVAPVGERTFYRHLAALLHRGLVENVGSERAPRYRPVEPATAASAFD